MTTIASPRPSLSTSSRRTSSETVTRSESRTRPPGARRNRTALREFYGLKDLVKAGESDSSETLPAEESSPQSEIDGRGFDADAYVTDLLDREGLEGILKVEASLLRDIRGFDGERKALVYDNYSKLIAATDTIRKMRGNMNPLKPAFTTLTPAISHIADTAKTMSSATSEVANDASDADMEHETQRQLVEYVLGTPTRLQRSVHEGKAEEAAKDWRHVAGILRQWRAVPGSDELRRECESIMASVQKG